MSDNKTEDIKLTDEQITALQIADEMDVFRSAFKNNGAVTGELDKNGSPVRLSFADAITSTSHPIAFKRVIEELVIEGVEPNLIGHKLLTTMNWYGMNTEMVKFRTYGAMEDIDFSMGEGMEYPELSLTGTSGQVTAQVGKFGAAVSITEEEKTNSNWDVIGLHIRELGRAMARDKEKRIFNMINNSGYVLIDNAEPDKSEIGRSTGRDLSGAGNGSFTADDMYEMYAKMLEHGFKPNVILCHPMAWAAFLKDPIMREHALHGGGGLGNWFNTMPTSNIGQGKFIPQAWKNATKLSGPTPFSPTQVEREGTQSSTFNFPSYFPGAGLTIIPSPHVPFDAEKRTHSIIMLDTNEVGALIQIEPPTFKGWDDHPRDISKVRIRERYALAVFNDGAAIGIAKNISLDHNEIVLPPQATVNTLPRIQRKD